MTCTVLLVAMGIAGCADDDSHRALVASAKCSLPTKIKIGASAQDLSATYSPDEVTSLGSGRYRVTGTASTLSEDERSQFSFTCEVAPDKSDRLRGFKVTRLETKNE